MPDNYFARYLPLLIHLIVAGGLASAIVLLSWFIGYRRPTRAKLSPYECGMVPIGDARERFSVKFYMVAMLFILFDVEAVKGKMMEVGEEITVADLRAALQKQNMQEADVKEGDAVFFNTGFGKLWIKNNDKFNSGEPGIGLEVAKWCIDKGVCMTGADTWATEVVPNPNKDLAFPVQWLCTRLL